MTRASSGVIDNTPIIEKTLAMKQEMAKLLGFTSFVNLSMASKVREERAWCASVCVG